MKAVLLEKLKIYMHRHTHMDVIIYDFSKRKMKTAYFLGLDRGILEGHFKKIVEMSYIIETGRLEGCTVCG